MAGPLAAHHSAVYMDGALFARVEALHERRAALGLTPEQLRLLERVHLDFVRAGARLQGDERRRYAQLMEELADDPDARKPGGQAVRKLIKWSHQQVRSR